MRWRNSMITELSIWGLRGFGEEKTICFATCNGKPGGGITFFVGGNNSGKTTIIEALRAFNCSQEMPPSFSERKRNNKSDGKKVHIKLLTDSNRVFRIDTSEQGGSPTTVECIDDAEGKWDPPSIFVVPSRRFTEYEFYRGEANRLDYIRNQQNNYFNRTVRIDDFSSRLFNMFRHKEEFDSLLKKVLGYELEWTIEQIDNGNYYLKVIVNGNEHSSEGMGDGIWSVFTICDALYDSNAGDIIAIDEPELSLHPVYQKRIMEILAEYAKDRQIILNTHSPYFIDLYSIVNGAQLCRTVKNKSGDIEIYTLSEESKNNLKGFISDLNQPHTFGLEAKEVFFLEDNIILVEGQEDVIMYKRILEVLNMSIGGCFFGWGVGGAPKMKKIIKVLKELGYKKVAVIFDGDKREEKEQLEKEYKGYSFFNISTDDIRDKKEIVYKPAKNGIMTSNGTLKDEYMEESRRLMEEMNNYFSIQ